MAEWKPFDLTWGRSIYYCTECKEDIEVPTSCGKPMYKFCPMCGANMNMKSENKQADTPQTDKDKVVCPNCGRSDYIRSFEKDFNIKNSEYRYKCINCNTYINDTPQTDWHYDEQDATWYPYKHEDEPQQKSCATCKHALGNWDGESNNCGRCCGADRRFYEPKTESQTEREGE